MNNQKVNSLTNTDDSYVRTARIGQDEQYGWDRTVTIRNLGQDRQGTIGSGQTAKTGQVTEEHGHDSQNRKARTGQQKRQSGQHHQDKKERLAHIYQLRQDNWDRKTRKAKMTAGKGQLDRTARTGHPLQDSQDRSARTRHSLQDNWY
jgi:hypothetical protein